MKLGLILRSLAFTVGQCAELCGAMHGFMPVVVRAVEPDEYKQWVAEHQQKVAAKTS